MAVVTWAPWADLDAMERRLRGYLGDLGIPAPMPAADVYETDGEFVVELEVPGYEQKNLVVELTDHTLVVKGELAEAKREEEKTFRLHERLEQSFERRFTLPREIDLEHVGADFVQGVLKVQAPKVKQPPARKIEIGSKA